MLNATQEMSRDTHYFDAHMLNATQEMSRDTHYFDALFKVNF